MRPILMIFIFVISITLYAGEPMIDHIYDKINSEMTNHELFEMLSNWQEYPVPSETGIFQQGENAINDTLEAPFVYYIPADYVPSEAKPLLIYLHGLVGIPDFKEDPLQYAEENYFSKFNEDEWFLLYPMSNIDCMWWDKTGTDNLDYQIRYLKERFNIDDNMIYTTGFSDGGSGSFHLALNNPDNYASLYPLNGMLSIGHAVNGIPVYIPNMINRYSRVINTDLDALYPASEMRKLMDLAIDIGADLFYKEYWEIGHDFAYAEEEIPQILADMSLHPRNPFRQKVYWETSLLEYGKCDWLEIVELDTLEHAAEWHNQHNLELLNKRMSFGFYSDREYAGPGARVTEVVSGSTVDEMGVIANDVILAMDGIMADDISHLTHMRDQKSRGDSFDLTILRDSKEIVLEGKFPEPERFQVFNYPLPSGAVKAKYFANQFHIETSRVRKLNVYIHPDMVNLDIPVQIHINGEKKFDDIITIDRIFILENFKQNLDRRALWVNKIEMNL